MPRLDHGEEGYVPRAPRSMAVVRPAPVALALLLLALIGAHTPAAAQRGLPLDPTKALTQYNLDAWTTDDGLPQGSITALLRTRDGYLWMGTQEGIARFDGLDFDVYDKRTTSLTNNYVTALLEDRQGRLWIGTWDGGLACLEDGRFTSFTAEDGLASNAITALLEDRQGRLWVGTFDAGLSLLGREGFTSFGQDITGVTTLYEDHDGAIWIGSRNGLHRFANTELTTYTTDDGLPTDDVRALLRAADGTLWAGTHDGGGLSRLNGDRFVPVDPAQGFPPVDVMTLYEDTHGTLWVGTDRGGLCRRRTDRFTCLTTQEGLTHNNITHLLEDEEGSLWIGTDGGGLNRLRDGKFTSYTSLEGLGHDYVFSVYEDDEGAIWIGTEGGGASRLVLNGDGIAHMTTYTTADGLPSDHVASIYGTRDGSIWMGTLGGGVSRFKNGRFTTYTTADGLPDDNVSALYADRQDNLWMATNEGLVRYRNGRFTTYTTADGLSSTRITAIQEDANGVLWVGTFDAGLNQRLGSGTFTAFNHLAPGLDGAFVLSFHAEADGTLWFTTLENGLHRLRDGVLTTYTTKDGLYNDSILHILEDNQGNLWLSSNRGLFVQNKAQIDAFDRGERRALAPLLFDKSDGLRVMEFMGGTQPAGWKDRRGRLWFPTNGAGVVSIHPDRLPRNAYPPVIIIEQATADDVSFPQEGVPSLGPGTDRVEIHYVGLSYLSPEKVSYQYVLEGYDRNWVEAGSRREAFYTNLPPGTYTFRVRARNHDGFWSTDQGRLSFIVQPFFYQTTLFYVLCALSLFLAGFGVYRLRVRHLKRRERELVQLVEARTADLREEKEKTELALKETEAAHREADRQRILAEEARSVIETQSEQLKEMDRIKTRFFNNISHEFRTPLTLNIGPLENALTGVYGPISNDLHRRLEVMLRNSRLLLRLINQLLDIARLESGRMEFRPRHGNLVDFLEGVVLSFTPFAEQKHLALSFTTDPETIPIAFDPGHLEKIFFNLLSNAVKFTPADGRVSVHLAYGTDAAGRESVVIRLRDTGPGIAEMELPYIFDRFHQVTGTVSRIQEGSGIGLSLVKELVEHHHGTIHVSSVVGEGTEFVVTLPRDLEASDDREWEGDGAGFLPEPVSHGPMVEMAVLEDGNRAASPVQTTTHAPGTPTILVIDDTPEIRDYVAGCLHDQFVVETAADGADGLDRARQLMPDLVVSDVMMPNMDGFAFCRASKKDPVLNHIPIILLTSRASLEEKIQGLEAGADDYLTKPFSAKELLVRVCNLLRISEQQRQLKTLNEELRQTNMELRELGQMKSQLLHIAAHDLKNPLNGIREFAKILQEDVDPDSPNREMLDLIHLSSDQMLDMVSKLLDSEALESGQLVLQREPVSLIELAEEVVRKNRAQARRKGELLVLDLDEADPCSVFASREWLCDAMDNLVSNAIKYSPFDTTIRVVVRRTAARIRFEVHDRGPGLTEDDKHRLFGKFQRLSALPTNNESSTGLGLSIVKQIVDLHEGAVWAESVYGQGSTFIIELKGLPVGEPVG